MNTTVIRPAGFTGPAPGVADLRRWCERWGSGALQERIKTELQPSAPKPFWMPLAEEEYVAALAAHIIAPESLTLVTRRAASADLRLAHEISEEQSALLSRLRGRIEQCKGAREADAKVDLMNVNIALVEGDCLMRYHRHQEVRFTAAAPTGATRRIHYIAPRTIRGTED